MLRVSLDEGKQIPCPPQLLQDVEQVPGGISLVFVVFQRVPEVRLRLGMALLADQRPAQVVLGIRVVRVQFRTAAVVFGGRVRVFEAVSSKGRPEEQGGCVGPLVLHGFPIGVQGLIPFLQVIADVPRLRPGPGPSRVLFKHVLQEP